MRWRWLIALPIGLAITAALFVGVMELMGWGDPSRLVYSLVGESVEVDHALSKEKAHLNIKINDEPLVRIVCLCVSSPPPPHPQPQLISPPRYQPDRFRAAQSDLGKLLTEPQRPRSANWILLNGPAPRYPQAQSQHGGYAVIGYRISEQGEPQDIEVMEASHPAFGRSAYAAVRNWRFIPRWHDGRPVVSEKITMRVEFRLEPTEH